MMQEPEDDRLDQSLRDTFSDFDLPPAGHVWRGIEGQLSAMSGPPRTVPLSLLLPAVGLVGVAVGWLLPHPAELTQKPQPTVTAQTAVQPNQLPAPAPLTYNVAPSRSNAVESQVKEQHSKPVARRAQPVVASTASPIAQAVSQPHPTDSVVLATAAEPTTNATVAVAESTAMQPVVSSSLAATSPTAASSSVASVVPVQDTAGAVQSRPATEPSKQNLREWRPEYRTPKHRLEERGGRLRRIRNSITKHWQHLFGARRSGQPAS